MHSGFQYIDGVGNVSVVNGMAHIDLVVVCPPAAEGEQPQVEPIQHLVMALPQFVRLCAEMAGHLQRMEQKGIIKRQPVDGAVAEGVQPHGKSPQLQTSAPDTPAAGELKRRKLFGRD